MHTLGCEIWLETMKNMENKKCKPQDMDYDEKFDKGKNETQTLFDMEYGQKN